jgi:hypothetical protein
MILSMTTTWFLRSPEWNLALYGPSAVVFTRRNVPPVGERRQVGTGIGKIKNLSQALIVYNFAGAIHDRSRADRVLTGMKSRFRCPGDPSKIQSASDWMARRRASFQGPREAKP